MLTCRIALSAVVLASSLLLGGGSASAGGPTSALLVEPASGRSASLTYVDKDYTDLMALVGADDGSSGAVDRSGADHQTEREVTVTWLIHNIDVWRVDRIYLGAAGAPWIATHVNISGTGHIFDEPAVWHRAADGRKLITLLERLGLTGGSPAVALGAAVPADRPGEGTSEAARVPAERVPVPAPGVAPSPRQADPPWSPTSVPALAALLGLATGIAVTSSILYWAARRTSLRNSLSHPGTAVQTDAGEIDDVPGVENTAWSPREELTSLR